MDPFLCRGDIECGPGLREGGREWAPPSSKAGTSCENSKASRTRQRGPEAGASRSSWRPAALGARPRGSEVITRISSRVGLLRPTRAVLIEPSLSSFSKTLRGDQAAGGRQRPRPQAVSWRHALCCPPAAPCFLETFQMGGRPGLLPPLLPRGGLREGWRGKGAVGSGVSPGGLQWGGSGLGGFRRRCLTCLTPPLAPHLGLLLTPRLCSSRHATSRFGDSGDTGVSWGAFQPRKLGRFPDQLFRRYHLPVSFLLRERGASDFPRGHAGPHSSSLWESGPGLSRD